MLTIYKASAGSGKTFTLAYEYIKMLLGRKVGNSPRYVLNDPEKGGFTRPHARILAITFTNKATAEMKSRILKELNDLASTQPPGGQDANYAAMLMAEFGCDREKLRVAAKRALRDLLNDYGAFNVSTIDSFFQTVLRSFAREIDRQGDYRVELDGKSALTQSLSMLFDEITLNPDRELSNEVIKWLQEESIARMSEGSDFNPFNRNSAMYRSIIESLSGIFNEDFMAYEQNMNQYLSDPENIRKFDTWIDGEIKRLRKQEDDATAEVIALGVEFTNTYAKSWLENIIREKGMTKTLYKKISDNAGYIAGMRSRDPQGAFTKKSGYVPSDHELDVLQRWVLTFESCFPLRNIYEQVKKKNKSLWAIFHIYDFMERFRQENNLILISDTNTLLKTIIDGSETPFIYERVGNELKNFLIDEFQDTSRMQWSNLLPLVGASLQTDDSLIIGDEKQSIYRFRGGDPQLLAEQVGKIDFPNDSIVRGDKEGENTNYRSAHDIVRFNNTLFREIASIPDAPVSGYAGVAQSLAKNTAGLSAWVKINDLTNKAFNDNIGKLLTPDEIEKLNTKGLFNSRGASLQIMANQILDQLKRGYRQSEIAILCYTRSAGAEVAEFLAREYSKEIKLISSDSLLLRNSSAVKLVISVMEIMDRSLEIPSEDGMETALATATIFKKDEHKSVLTKYLMRRRRAALIDCFEYLLAHGIPFDEALSRAVKTARAVGTDTPDGEHPTGIAADLAKIRQDSPANIAALVQAILLHKVPRPVRMAELSYIATFIDVVDEYMQNFTPSIHSFLTYWEDNKDNLAISPGEREEAVTITTIHQAKGLEWPCLHLPLVDWKYDEAPGNGWYSTDCIPCPSEIIKPGIIYMKPNDFFGLPGSPFREQFESEKAENRTDNVNKTYVAFTRAARELHVNIISSKKDSGSKSNKSSITSIGNVILDVIRKTEPISDKKDIYIDLSKHLTDTGLEIGGPTLPKREDTDSEIIETIPAPQFEISFDSLGDRLTQISEFVSIADTGRDIIEEKEEKEENPKMEEAARKGSIMHAILSHMQTIDDLDDAIDRFRREIDGEELQEFRNLLENAFGATGELALRWFDSANKMILTEQSIYSRRTDTTHRPDRIVFLEDGSVEVVDYKFTSAPRDEHYEQVRDYGIALAGMGKEVKAFLWYPLLNKIINVDF